MNALRNGYMVFGARMVTFALLITAVELPQNAAYGQRATLVKDLNTQPSAASSSPGQFVQAGGVVYFAAIDGVSGFGLNAGLWRTDGTAAGTKPVRMDVNAIQELTAVGNTVFFSAVGSIGGRTLWKSDGTPEGTVLVNEISKTRQAFPGNLTNVRGALYFSACTDIVGSNCEPWKSDGTQAGTVRVKDINVGPDSSFPRSFTELNGVVLFAANDGVSGEEIWRTDGTEAGTMRVKDINPGAGSSSPRSFVNLNGHLYFPLMTEPTASRLWRTDGTEAGTVRVKDINPGAASSFPIALTKVGGTLFFSAADSAGRELWKSDGTEAGTVRVKDIVPGPGSSSPFGLLNLNGIVLFSASGEPSFGDRELWRSDGTETGTYRVKDINPGAGSSSPDELVAFHGAAYFRVCASAVYGQCQLWKSDGTEAGTTLVKSVDAVPGVMVVSGRHIFFPANDHSAGQELWAIPVPSEGGERHGPDDSYRKQWTANRRAILAKAGLPPDAELEPDAMAELFFRQPVLR